MLEVGSIIAGKLRIERILGQGGMGIVAEATHLQLDQRVAVKVMRDQVADEPSTVERFLREARAAAKLRSEHVVRVTDVGQLESGAPYIVMELLAGKDLAALIARTPLSIEIAVDYVLQACIAIGEAHVHGIVHRDLKPANLFLTKHVGGAPLVKVLDFGIAKAPAKSDTALTQTESVMGSPGYMSPEQLRSARDVDARTDIWALGVILYQLVSCKLPFPATSVTELAMKVGMDPPEPLDVPDPAFRAVVFRCLEKSPTARFPDVPALAAALAPFGSESARRSLAVIEQLAPRPLADAMAPTMAPTPASSLAPVDVHARTAASITTLGGATGYVEIPDSAKHTRKPMRRAPLVVGALGISAAAIATVFALNANRGGSSTTTVAATSAGSAEPMIGSAVGSAEAPAEPSAEAGSSAEAPRPEASNPETSMQPTTKPVGNKKVAAARAQFETALKRKRCIDATDALDGLERVGAPPDVIADAKPRLNQCLSAEFEEMEDMTKPKAATAVLHMAQQWFDKGKPDAAIANVETVLHFHPGHQAALALGVKAACKAGKPAVARGYATKLPAGVLRDEAVAYCKTNKIDLESKSGATDTAETREAPAKNPLKDADANEPPTHAVGRALGQGDYTEAVELALAIHAKDPKNMQAIFQLVGAYCLLDDAVNAKKWLVKLDPKRRDNKWLHSQCRHLNIDPSAP